MYNIMSKSLRNGAKTNVRRLEATTFEEAVVEFTSIVREWLQMDTTGTRNWSPTPEPGYYDESDNEILLDADTTERYNDGHNEYFIEEA